MSSITLSLVINGVITAKTAAEFEYQAGNAFLGIQARFQSYVDLLHSTGALFYTSSHIMRDQFRAYVLRLNLQESFPGITNLNFGQHIPAQRKHAFEAEIRSDTSIAPYGYPDFAVKSVGEPAAYHVLTYIEPMERNLSSFGLDIASNPRSAAALATARDTGQIISSGRLIKIEGPFRHTGLAMRLPLYHLGMPLDTVAQRRTAYYGSAGIGIDIDKLMLGTLDKKILPYMRLELYDAGSEDAMLDPGITDPARLLFDSSPALAVNTHDLLTHRARMTIGKHIWEAKFSASKAAMTSGLDAYIAWFILAGGLIASLLLSMVNYSLATARRRAIELAEDMTKDLRTSEASLAEAQHMARLGSWLLDPITWQMIWSAETYRILGRSDIAVAPDFDGFLSHLIEGDRSRMRYSLEQVIDSGAEFNMEHRITRADGTTRWVHTIARVSHADGKTSLHGTIMDITERKLTMEALKHSQELLREHTAHQDRVKEEERKRIAREIHDELGQTLLALRIDVSLLHARTGISHPRLNQKVQGALSHIDATVRAVKTIINNLRPAALDLGLSAAIEWQVNEFSRRTGIACELKMETTEFAIDDMRATALFRILQESLTNVTRHANATRVVIELFEKQDELVMRISDNGVGIGMDLEKRPNSFGLIGIKERIHALHGRFLFASVPGQGTRLTIHLPVSQVTFQTAPPELELK